MNTNDVVNITITVSAEQYAALLRKVSGKPDKLDYWFRRGIDMYFNGYIHGSKDFIDLSGEAAKVRSAYASLNPDAGKPKMPVRSDLVDHKTGQALSDEQWAESVRCYEWNLSRWEEEKDRQQKLKEKTLRDREAA